jgi:hypothetical protein
MLLTEAAEQPARTHKATWSNAAEQTYLRRARDALR